MGHICATAVSFSVKNARLLERVDLDAHDGQLVGLLGPNGSGKTTLLRLLAGLRRPQAGQIHYDGVDLASQRRRTIARRLAVVEQDTSAHTDLTVRQVVELGRTPFRGRFDPLTEADHQIIDAALEQVDIADKQHRNWHSLSGGEKQRAQLARALAQQPREILLDEPTNHLDIRHQLELLELLRSLNATCVIALHDLNLAARYCDHVVVLDSGTVAAAGAPAEVFSQDLLRNVYEVDAVIDREPATGAVRITYQSAITLSRSPRSTPQ
ncbi:ABC transporter ATP-binding protein [Mycobacterium sp. SMC-4]|uniref:ABC transporter ATP-binding protein n=1 Tax=Mycobacterium sp. SMC-4 TaxID=2857059 RepID=UPI0021B32298|nr:ABC transporter ATP-binding protein [Mycobacterium sp. SMC-4]UXA17251.1 ABC transporter ATP-binding protein [Mycobacterium sp. SMC-4]